MKERRTVQIKLEVPSEAEEPLETTAQQFLHCANRASKWAWNESGNCTMGQGKARRALYDPLRDETELHANLVQKAIRQAISAVRSGVARRKKGQNTSRPEFTALSLVYDKRSATFSRDRVSLSTVNGRVECEYVLPSGSDTPHQQYLQNEEYQFRTSTLHLRDGEWYLHAVLQRSHGESDSDDTEHRTVLGVDLGVHNLVVSSTGRFWSGKEYSHWRREYERRRSSLQQCGTRWAHETIDSVARKERGRFKQSLHRLTNELIEEAIEHDCAAIIFEDLTDIGKRLPQASWHHLWAFRRITDYVAYKAPRHGLNVEFIDPTNTSTRCSTCGSIDSNNRVNQTFHCTSCGYQNHADYNAAKNIGYQYLRRQQNADGGGAPVGVRLNSGILTTEGIKTRSGVTAPR